MSVVVEKPVKEEKNRSILTGKRIIIIVGICWSLFLIYSILMLPYNIFGCNDRRYIFLREYNADYNSKNETILRSCKGCLWIEAMPINNAYILGFKKNPPANGLQEEIVKINTDKFFFADEVELKGFEPWSEIEIRWCPTPNGKRIRGVWSV